MVLIDGLEYPDIYRGFWGRDEYASIPDEENLSSRMPKIPQHIRIYDKNLKTHTYCEYRYPQPGDTGLICVDFRRDDGHLFCFVDKWGEGVEHIAQSTFMRYDHLHDVKDEMPMMVVKIGSKVHHTRQYNYAYFYRVLKTIQGSEDITEK